MGSAICVYRQYLQDLLTYLEQFYDRTNPLGSMTKVYGKLGFDFDSAFEEGQVPGWEDRGAGKVPGQQGSAMDLQAFDTVDELESLGELSFASYPVSLFVCVPASLRLPCPVTHSS